MRKALLFGLLAFALSVVPARADPFYIPNPGTPGSYFDFTFAVGGSIALVPGEVGFVPATVQNTGTLPLTWQLWDETLSMGGSGWNSFDQGFIWGCCSRSLGPHIRVAEGHTTDINPSTIGQDPDFSALSGVTINPGATFNFDIFSVWLDPTTAIGTIGSFSSFGSFAYGGYRQTMKIDDFIRVNWTASLNPSTGGLNAVGVGDPTPFPAFIQDPRQVPEPSTLLLLSGGLAAVLVGRRRRPVRRLNADGWPLD